MTEELTSFFSFFTIPFTGNEGTSASPIFMIGFLIPFLIFGLMFIGGAIFILYGVVGAIITFQGRNFRYAIIGNSLERYLQKSS